MFDLAVIVLFSLLGLVHAWLQWSACRPLVERRWRKRGDPRLSAAFRDPSPILDPTMKTTPHGLVALVIVGWGLVPLALVGRLVGWGVVVDDLAAGGLSDLSLRALSASSIPMIGLCAGLLLFVVLSTVAQHHAYWVCLAGDPAVSSLALSSYQRSSLLVDGALVGMLAVGAGTSGAPARHAIVVAVGMLVHLVALSAAMEMQRHRLH